MYRSSDINTCIVFQDSAAPTPFQNDFTSRATDFTKSFGSGGLLVNNDKSPLQEPPELPLTRPAIGSSKSPNLAE